MTTLQQAIMNIIQSSGHLTADDIYMLVKKAAPTASMSNVYRNLNQFADRGQILRIQRANKADYFEKNVTPHNHAVCSYCGEMSDITINGLDDFIRANCSVPIESFDLVVNFLCPECKEKV